MRNIKRFKKSVSAGLNEILILLILYKSPHPLYGYQILQFIARYSEGKIKLRHNVVYTILNKLEKGGYIRSRWASSDDGVHRRKYYSLTVRGESYLKKILRI